MSNWRPVRQCTISRHNEGFSTTLWTTAERKACITGSAFFQPFTSWENAMNCVKFVLIFSQKMWLSFPREEEQHKRFYIVFFHSPTLPPVLGILICLFWKHKRDNSKFPHFSSRWAKHRQVGQKGRPKWTFSRHLKDIWLHLSQHSSRWKVLIASVNP